MNKNIEISSLERSNIIRDYNSNFKITRRDRAMIGLIIFIMVVICLIDLLFLCNLLVL
jgi:hypothetical protein